MDLNSKPIAFVIFGATGDLAKKRIFPALFKLYTQNLLPTQIKVICAARTVYTSESFQDYVYENLKIENRAAFDDFAKTIEYLPIDVAEDKNLKDVTAAISKFEKEVDACPQTIYYMSIAPDIFSSAIENLGAEGLNISCSVHNSKPRIIIEKPFGSSLESALTLKLLLEKYFDEEQIYRIDHYLGKETVQNIFAFRFGNEIFEPTWSNEYIDHIQIITSESIGVEKRGEFYDRAGALRDITQNHLLQLLSIITMEEPKGFNPKDINERKLAVLKDVKTLSPEEVAQSTVRGQYEGYLQEEKINPKSQTETYALVKLEVDNPRWRGVPIYMRTGKKLMGKVTSIIVQFKDTRHKLFGDLDMKPTPNHIILQIQPNEGIGIRLVAKKPGLETTIEPVDMEFCYKNTFDEPQPEAYERLIMDVVQGDQSLFISQEVIEQCWRIIDPIKDAWSSNKVPLATYKPGTWGPTEADELLKHDKRDWLTPFLTICKI
ncbi:glucose-6-phosphate dehydrogenase [Candidatus Curtissbacteria bacterium]|nr:glucose-6-phosphate dehydrogenase [Candidatus Curtissbacteria bacterium]